MAGWQGRRGEKRELRRGHGGSGSRTRGPGPVSHSGQGRAGVTGTGKSCLSSPLPSPYGFYLCPIQSPPSCSDLSNTKPDQALCAKRQVGLEGRARHVWGSGSLAGPGGQRSWGADVPRPAVYMRGKLASGLARCVALVESPGLCPSAVPTGTWVL